MERIEQCAAYEVLRPEHVRGPDQKPAANTRKAKAGKCSGEDEEDLKPKAKMEAIIELRDNDGLNHVRWTDGDVGHHVNQYMFLDIEGAWVEGEFPTAKDLGQHPFAGREDVCKCFSKWVCNEEHNRRHNVRCWVAEGEKDVEAGPDED